MHSAEGRHSGRRALLAATLLTLAACGGGGSAPPPQPPDLSGVWAGTWQGGDPQLGPVTGTWEAVLEQGDSTVTGTATLLGDVDCMDGVVAGGVDANSLVSGTYDRNPCAPNTWTLTALDVAANFASGVWTQPGTGASGSMTGRRIAVPGGPRVLFANPPAGRAGAVVTLVGTGFGATAIDNSVGFGAAQVQPLSAEPTTIRVRVPAGAALAPVSVTAPTGLALSPRAFDPFPGTPAIVVAGSIDTGGSSPQGVAVSPDGRKLYVANRGSGTEPGSISVVDTTRRIVLGTPTALAATAEPTALVASPDGKRVFVAAGSAGVLVLEAALGAVVDTIAVPAGGGTFDNPQGIALSPDGRLLYVTDGREGGTLSIVDLATRTANTVATGAAEVPLGVAVHPDGTKVYLAVADASGSGGDTVRVLAAPTGQPLQTLPAGARPTAIAITPDGLTLLVTNQLANTVDVFDTVTEGLSGSFSPGLAPTGIVASPDGMRVLIALKGENRVSAWVIGGGEAGRADIGLEPTGVAIAPSGRVAFASNAGGASVSEIGGSQTLTVSKSGTGIGTVGSNPAGIDCGTACVVSFDTGTVVVLSAVAAAGSTFSGWAGEADCSDGIVTMTGAVSCSAIFAAIAPPTAPAPGGGGCFIATAAWGSPMAAEVESLRQFRDRVLMSSDIGRSFVRAYYDWSPPVADFIRERDALRAATRVGLWPVVQGVRHPVESIALALLLLAAPVLVRAARRANASAPPR